MPNWIALKWAVFFFYVNTGYRIALTDDQALSPQLQFSFGQGKAVSDMSLFLAKLCFILTEGRVTRNLSALHPPVLYLLAVLTNLFTRLPSVDDKIMDTSRGVLPNLIERKSQGIYLPRCDLSSVWASFLLDHHYAQLSWPAQIDRNSCCLRFWRFRMYVHHRLAFQDKIVWPRNYPAIDAYKPQVSCNAFKVYHCLTIFVQDATTNPSLILAAANKPNYAHLIDAAIIYGKEKGGDLDAQADHALDRLVRAATNIATTKLTVNC